MLVDDFNSSVVLDPATKYIGDPFQKKLLDTSNCSQPVPEAVRHSRMIDLVDFNSIVNLSKNFVSVW